MTYSDQVRSRGLNALLGFTFFMVIGFTMLMPLVAIHFVNDIGFTATLVGVALAVRQFTQQGLAIVGGALADRFGTRGLICTGVLLRAAGFGSLAWAVNPPLLLVSMVLSALGGALFEVPYQASIAALTSEETRPRYYTISNLVVGIATTLGPLLGIALLRFNFQLVCLVAAACFVLNFVLAVVLLPPITTAAKEGNLGYGLRLVLRDHLFLSLTALLMAYWFTAVQINISFPLLAEQLTGNRDSIGIMFALNAGLTVVLQYPLVRLLERWFSPDQILVIGVVTISLGVGGIVFAQSFAILLACVAVFAIGGVLTRPTHQTLIASMADTRALGVFLGVSSLGLALGGGIGNSAGGWLLDLAYEQQLPALPWIVFCVVGLLSASGLAVLSHIRHRSRTAAHPEEAGEATSPTARPQPQS